MGLLGFTWVPSGSLGFTRVYLGSLGLILVDVGDLGCRVLNLRNVSNIQTNRQRIPRMSRDPVRSRNIRINFESFFGGSGADLNL